MFAAESHNLFDVNSTVVEHVQQTSERLVERSRLIGDAVHSGRTAVVGVTYRLAEGKAQIVSGFGIS